MPSSNRYPFGHALQPFRRWRGGTLSSSRFGVSTWLFRRDSPRSLTPHATLRCGGRWDSAWRVRGDSLLELGSLPALRHQAVYMKIAFAAIILCGTDRACTGDVQPTVRPKTRSGKAPVAWLVASAHDRGARPDKIGRCESAQGHRRVPASNWRLARYLHRGCLVAVGNRKEIYD
jgi:hypothetical protein